MKRILAASIFLTIVSFLPVPAPLNGHPFKTSESIKTTPFAFNLLNAVLQQDTSRRNKLISPFSVYISLCLLYNGAGYATKDSIAEALQLNGMNIFNLNALCKNMLQEIHLEDNKAQISFARSLWCNRKKGALLPTFTTVADACYYTASQSLNFNAPNASTRINNWVDQNLAHKPAAALPAANPKDFLYYIDAAYFSGGWLYPFEAGHTDKDLFYLPDGHAKTVSFMKQELVTRVYSDTSITMFELPCGKGQAFSMYILLPDDPQLSLRDFAVLLNEERLNRTIQRMNDQDLQLSLPSWEYAYSIPGIQLVLSQLGMGLLFDREGNADLSGMIKTGRRTTAISKALYNTYIKVNEQGARASLSTTRIVADSTGKRRHRPLVLKVDRPFLYLILEKQRNILLFAGAVNDPAGR